MSSDSDFDRDSHDDMFAVSDYSECISECISDDDDTTSATIYDLIDSTKYIRGLRDASDPRAYEFLSCGLHSLMTGFDRMSILRVVESYEWCL